MRARGLAIFSWASLFLSTFYSSYIGDNAVVKGEVMFKNLWMIMDYATYAKWQIVGIASGIALGWMACDVWKHAYDDAKEGGAVA